MTNITGKPLVSQTMLVKAFMDVLKEQFDFPAAWAEQAAASALERAERQAKHSFIGDGTQADAEVPF